MWLTNPCLIRGASWGHNGFFHQNGSHSAQLANFIHVRGGSAQLLPAVRNTTIKESSGEASFMDHNACPATVCKDTSVRRRPKKKPAKTEPCGNNPNLAIS